MAQSSHPDFFGFSCFLYFYFVVMCATVESFHMRCRRRILHIRWHDYISNNEVLRLTGLLAASSIVRKRRLGLFSHVARLADDVPSKSDPLDLLRSTRRCPAVFWLEACPRPTSYHLDSADLPRHWSYGDRRPAAGRRRIVLATNRNGGKLRLNASRAGRKEGRSRKKRSRLHPSFNALTC